MQRRRLDRVLVVGVLTALAVLMRVPPHGRVAPPDEPHPHGVTRVRVVVDNGINDDDSFSFEMQREGVYETRMHLDGRDFTLHGSASEAEFERVARELAPLASARGATPCTRAALVRPAAPAAARYTLQVEDVDGVVRQTCLDDAWTPRYQSLSRLLDRTLVGRTHEALKKAAGL